MKKTETQKKYLMLQIIKWPNEHEKIFRIISSAIYVIMVIIFAIFTIDFNGGVQETLSSLNNFPTEKYEQIEEELRNIIVEGDGIYPNKLSDDSIKFNISYDGFEHYTIELTDEVTVTGIIGKDLVKANLKISRDYKTKQGYIRAQHIMAIISVIFIPLVLVMILYGIIYIFLFGLLFIEFISKLILNQFFNRKENNN